MVYAVRTIADVLLDAQNAAEGPDNRHICTRCGVVYVDPWFMAICTPMNQDHLPRPFLRRRCPQCQTG